MKKEVETELSRSVDMAGDKAEYDTYAKNLLSNKPILAWILKSTIAEFKETSIRTIVNLIEGEPEVGTVPMEPGMTNAPRVTGIMTESDVPYEGRITFDIRFFVYRPDRSEMIKLIINVEAQKDFNPGYDLTTRGVFYGARMLSAQYGTEFVKSRYDDIKKVYSIWVCTKATGRISDTITGYHMTPHSIYGDYYGEDSRYDLLEVIMICLGNKTEKTNNRIINLLETLFASDISVETKKQVLYSDFGIEPTEKIDEELRVMCNLSDNIEERGIEKGIEIGVEKGIEKGKLIARAEMVDEHISQSDARIRSLEEVCVKFNISVEDYYAVKNA